MVVKIGDPRSRPKPLIEIALHIVRYERRTTQRARLLVVTDPPVHAPFVEDVTTIREVSYLVLALELVQAHGARLGRVDQVRELDDGQDFADQNGRRGVELGEWGGRVGPGIVGLDEILETQ